jgi:hypothetical protein
MLMRHFSAAMAISYKAFPNVIKVTGYLQIFDSSSLLFVIALFVMVVHSTAFHFNLQSKSSLQGIQCSTIAIIAAEY